MNARRVRIPQAWGAQMLLWATQAARNAVWIVVIATLWVSCAG